MAEEDKTYCGQDDRSHVDIRNESDWDIWCRELGITREDMADIMSQVGNDFEKVSAYVKAKQNSY